MSANKATEMNKMLTTDSKEALYDALYKAPLTRKIGLKTIHFR